MTKAITFHKAAVSSILDLIRYQKLKHKSTRLINGIFANTKKLVIITDSNEINETPLKEISFLKETFGTQNIRTVLINSEIIHSKIMDNLSLTTLNGEETASESEKFNQLVLSLNDFAADTYIIRMHKPSSALRRIILRTAVDTRISLGDTVPAPFCNIHIHDPNVELKSFFI